MEAPKTPAPTDNITHAVLGGLGLLVAFPPESMQRRAGLDKSSPRRGSEHTSQA
jgi:hypothetical protein